MRDIDGWKMAACAFAPMHGSIYSIRGLLSRMCRSHSMKASFRCQVNGMYTAELAHRWHMISLAQELLLLFTAMTAKAFTVRTLPELLRLLGPST